VVWARMQNKTYILLVHSVRDALNDVFDDRFMVSVGLVISEPHHSPMRDVWVPVNLYDAVVELITGGFHPGFSKGGRVNKSRVRRG
jgi:hypothetical protein